MGPWRKCALRVLFWLLKQTPKRQTIGRLGAPKRIAKSAESLPVIGAILGAAGHLFVRLERYLAPGVENERPIWH